MTQEQSFKERIFKVDRIDFIILISLIAITLFISILVYDKYNAEIFIFDDTIYLNVVNNLLNGNGFSVDLVFDVYYFDLENDKIDHYTIDRTSERIIEKYPELGWEYGKPPLFFLILALFFRLVSADFSNIVFFASVFNTLITIIFICFYYIFSKNYFGRGVGIISVLLILTSFAILRNITAASPNQLVYLFILLTIFFINKTNKHYILFGIFASLASLTNQIGVLPIAAYSLFLICKKEIKGFAIVFGIWLTIVSPWMVRQYTVFGDFGSGLGIPFSREISSLFGESVIHSSLPQSLKYNPSLPFETYTRLWFDTPFNMLPVFLLTIFAVVAFLPIQNKKQLKHSERFKLIFILCVVVSFFIGYTLAVDFFNQKYLNIIIQLLGIIIIPTTIYFVINRLFTVNKISRSYQIIIIYCGIFLFIIYYAALIALSPSIFVAFPLIFLILPFAIKGLRNLIEKIPVYLITKSKYSGQNTVNTNYFGIFIIFIIFIPIVFFTAQNNINYMSSPLNWQAGNWHQLPQIQELQQWIRNNIERDKILMNDRPGPLFVRTGNPVVTVPSDHDKLGSLVGYIMHYKINYVVLYQKDDLVRKSIEFLDPDIVYENEKAAVLKIKSELLEDPEKELFRIVNQQEKRILSGDLSLDDYEDMIQFYEKLIDMKYLDVSKAKEEFIQKAINTKMESVIKTGKKDKEINQFIYLANEMHKDILNRSFATEMERKAAEEKYLLYIRDAISYYEDKRSYNDLLRVYQYWIDSDRLNKEPRIGKAETLEKLDRIDEAYFTYKDVPTFDLTPEEVDYIQNKIKELEARRLN